ncbi:putative hydro-lyase [Parageobacillus sp. VR-IP]|uniref:putative hydro-lyase n=1 Tax=Parageobacillus sp. VR-IP TaxID=2742205 RepID=UPI00158347C1|nr:putative hydro-lyase [Parageobacillus sp. VR-IP]NUK29375.1 putative hydro-lyase [Parageobacillus sp. VR-IP]
MKELTPREFREMVKQKKWDKPTSGIVPGYTQANLVILPKEDAFDFLLFCQRNPKPCPLLEVTDVGDPILKTIASHADIRTDLPKYRIYQNGRFIKEVTDIVDIWRDDFVAFLIGCSFTFENALIKHGISIRHIEEQRNVPMYKTNIPCVPAGRFHGNMVVSMRPMTPKDAIKSVQITSRFPAVHGAPVHIGRPEDIGIYNLDKPDFGDPVTIKEGEVPVFWACGVTPQAVAIESNCKFMITHAPGHMFVSDLKDEFFAIL